MGVNYRDLIFKVMWTCLQAGASYLLVASADWRGVYVLPVAAVLTAMTGLARQHLGTTPPDSAAVDAMDELTNWPNDGVHNNWRDARPWEAKSWPI